MTLTLQVPEIIVDANGSTTNYAFNFLVPYQDDGSTPAIAVTWINADGGSVPLSPADYTVVGVGNDSGGHVVYPKTGPALATGNKIAISRHLSYTQGHAFPNSGFFPKAIETALDRLALQIQQLAASVRNVLRAPAGETVDLLLPNILARAGKLLGFASDGTVLVYDIVAALAGKVNSSGSTQMTGPLKTPGIDLNGAFTAGFKYTVENTVDSFFPAGGRFRWRAAGPDGPTIADAGYTFFRAARADGSLGQVVIYNADGSIPGGGAGSGVSSVAGLTGAVSGASLVSALSLTGAFTVSVATNLIAQRNILSGRSFVTVADDRSWFLATATTGSVVEFNAQNGVRTGLHSITFDAQLIAGTTASAAIDFFGTGSPPQETPQLDFTITSTTGTGTPTAQDGATTAGTVTVVRDATDTTLWHVTWAGLGSTDNGFRDARLRVFWGDQTGRLKLSKLAMTAGATAAPYQLSPFDAAGLGDVFSLDTFGAAGGSNDDTYAFVKAGQATANVGGGTITLARGPYRTEGIVALGQTVKLQGSLVNLDDLDFTNAATVFPAGTWIANGAQSSTLNQASGLLIVEKTYRAGFPYANQAAKDTALSAAPGIALQAASGDDSTYEDCFIAGFQTAVYDPGFQRLRVRRVKGETKFGIVSHTAGETAIIEDCLFKIGNIPGSIAYVMGGTDAAHFVDAGWFLSNIFEYGYDVGLQTQFSLGGKLLGGGFDGPLKAGTYGIIHGSGGSATNGSGCRAWSFDDFNISGKGTGIWVRNTQTFNGFTPFRGFGIWGCTVALAVDAGDNLFSNGTFFEGGTPIINLNAGAWTGTGGLTGSGTYTQLFSNCSIRNHVINITAGNVTINGGDMTGTVINLSGGTLVMNNVVGNPTINNTGGTYTTQDPLLRNLVGLTIAGLTLEQKQPIRAQLALLGVPLNEIS